MAAPQAYASQADVAALRQQHQALAALRESDVKALTDTVTRQDQIVAVLDALGKTVEANGRSMMEAFQKHTDVIEQNGRTLTALEGTVAQNDLKTTAALQQHADAINNNGQILTGLGERVSQIESLSKAEIEALKAQLVASSQQSSATYVRQDAMTSFTAQIRQIIESEVQKEVDRKVASAIAPFVQENRQLQERLGIVEEKAKDAESWKRIVTQLLLENARNSTETNRKLDLLLAANSIPKNFVEEVKPSSPTLPPQLVTLVQLTNGKDKGPSAPPSPEVNKGVPSIAVAALPLCVDVTDLRTRSPRGAALPAVPSSAFNNAAT